MQYLGSALEMSRMNLLDKTDGVHLGRSCDIIKKLTGTSDVENYASGSDKDMWNENFKPRNQDERRPSGLSLEDFEISEFELEAAHDQHVKRNKKMSERSHNSFEFQPKNVH